MIYVQLQVLIGNLFFFLIIGCRLYHAFDQWHSAWMEKLSFQSDQRRE